MLLVGQYTFGHTVRHLQQAGHTVVFIAQHRDQVARPEWRVGDRWVFRRTTVGGTTSVVTYQVTAATADGYTLRLGGLVPEVTETWTPELHLRAQQIAGRAAALFEPAAMFFAWPLRLGKTWSQTFTFRDGGQAGQYVNEWRVGPVVESLLVLAGSFYVVRIEPPKR